MYSSKEMISLADCYQQHEGAAVSYDGTQENKGQCAQWSGIVWRDVYGGAEFFVPYAVDWWTEFDSTPLPTLLYKVTDNSVKRGDFVVYGTGLGVAGHIDVAAQDGTLQDYIGYDSNWGGAAFHDKDGYPILHTVHHADQYNQYILGALRPKEGAEMFNDGDAVNISNQLFGEVAQFVKDQVGKSWHDAMYEITSEENLEQYVRVNQGDQVNVNNSLGKSIPIRGLTWKQAWYQQIGSNLPHGSATPTPLAPGVYRVG